MPQCPLEPASEAWLSLTLDEGQPGRAQGLLVRLGDRVGIVPDGGLIARSGSAVESVSPVVELRLTYSSSDTEHLVGRSVSVTGFLESGVLVIDSPTQLSPRGTPARVLYTEQDSSSMGGQRIVPPRSQVERALMKQGLLVDVWEVDNKDGSHRRIALATDVDKVRAALLRHDESPLDIVESRLSEEALRTIESELAIDDLTWSLGRSIGEDWQMRVTATLLHLPLYLARRLQRLPPNSLVLDVLVTPV